jgi:hypothetical protein
MTNWTMKLFTYKPNKRINYKYLHDSRINTTTPILSLRRTSLQSPIPSRHTISVSSLAIRSARLLLLTQYLRLQLDRSSRNSLGYSRYILRSAISLSISVSIYLSRWVLNGLYTGPAEGSRAFGPPRRRTIYDTVYAKSSSDSRRF